MRIRVVHVELGDRDIEKKSTLIMSFYMPLFLALVKRKGYSCEVSEPQLVNGSATPPPSKRYPGLVCYMVTITVDKIQYHGYGPTAALARQFAAFEAYKVLAPVLSRDVSRSVQDSGVECAQDDDSASVSTIDDVLSSVCSEPTINGCSHRTSLLNQTANEGGVGNFQEEKYCQETPTLVDQQSKEIFTNLVPESNSEKNHKKWIPTESEKGSNVVNAAPHGGWLSVAASDVPPHDGSGRIKENCVGQLQEVFMKEFKVLPVFAESTQASGPGSSVEFVCTVEINDLSARGEYQVSLVHNNFLWFDLQELVSLRS